MSNSRLANRIKEYRSARGIGVEAIAQEAGVTDVELQRIEAGERGLLNPILLERIAAALSITLDDLLSEPLGDLSAKGAAKSAGDDQIEVVIDELPDRIAQFARGEIESGRTIEADVIRTLASFYESDNGAEDDLWRDRYRRLQVAIRGA